MIYEEFAQETNIKDKSIDELNNVLIRSIIDTKKDLENARRNYEYAEGELIDYYLYQIKASQAKLNYLIKKSKETKLNIDMIKDIEIRKIENVKAV